jgi:hypothetical protein
MVSQKSKERARVCIYIHVIVRSFVCSVEWETRNRGRRGKLPIGSKQARAKRAKSAKSAKSTIRAKKVFPNRDSNPGLLGESQPS